MRIVRIAKDSSVTALVAEAEKAAPGSLAKLNPHVDLKRLAPGDVLVLPDAATGPRAAAATPIAAEAMQTFIGFAKEAFDASARRVQQAADRAAAEETALAGAAKSKGVKSAIDKDPELKKLLDGASAQAKADTKSSADAVKGFAELSKASLGELEALAKRLA